MYRFTLFSSLKKAYQKIWNNAYQSGKPLAASIERALKIRTIYGWDKYVVLPRYEFDSVTSYQEYVSLNAERLKQLKIPSYIPKARYPKLQIPG